jgi:hypothetical protein
MLPRGSDCLVDFVNGLTRLGFALPGNRSGLLLRSEEHCSRNGVDCYSNSL